MSKERLELAKELLDSFKSNREIHEPFVMSFEYETIEALEYIIEQVEKGAPGSKFAIGTEINLVNRLQAKHPDKSIISLSPYQCLCTTMYRVRPRWLLASFRAIKENKPINVIKVSDDVRRASLVALERMLSIV